MVESNSPSSYFFSTKKSLILRVGPLSKKKSLITVLYVSLYNPEQEILQRFSFFSYWLPAVHGDDVIVPSAIIVFPRARYNILHNIDIL